MAGILKKSLRLVGSTKNIKINATNYQRFIYNHVVNCYNNTVKNSTKQDQFNYECRRLKHVQAQMNLVKYFYNYGYKGPFKADATSNRMIFEEQKKNARKQEISSKISNLNIISRGDKMILDKKIRGSISFYRFTFDNTANIKIKGNMPINVSHNTVIKENQKVKSISSEDAKFKVTFNDGKLILTTRNGITYTIKQTLFIKADNKFNKNLQNVYATEEKASTIETKTLDIGKFNVLFSSPKSINGNEVHTFDEKTGKTIIEKLDENLKNEIGETEKTSIIDKLLHMILDDCSLKSSRLSDKTTLKTLEGDESLSVHQMVDVEIKKASIKASILLIVDILKRVLRLTPLRIEKYSVIVDSGEVMLINQQGGTTYINKKIYVEIQETQYRTEFFLL